MNDFDPSDLIKKLKISYHSGHGDHLYRDFYSPLLSKAKHYIRETGDFTTNVIFDWGAGLVNAIEREPGECLIKMIANPKLQESDRDTLLEVVENKNNQRYLEELKDYILKNTEKIIEKSFEEARNDIHREIKLKIFAYLIANRILILKFGKPTHVPSANIFHPKSGVFYFDNEKKVGFIGGSNETHGGYVSNVEHIHVYDNLRGENPHIQDIETKFNIGWQGNAKGFETYNLKKEFLKKIETYAPSLTKLKEDIKKYNNESKNKIGEFLPVESVEKLKKIVQSNNKSSIDEIIEPKENYLDVNEPKWEFQKKAREIFIEKKWGILEMATGTGKTRTALSIATQLINENKIDKIILQMEGIDLIKQWTKNVAEWTESRINRKVNLLDDDNEDFDFFLMNYENTEVDFIIIRQSRLPKLLDAIKNFDQKKTLIIHDEVHDLFADEISQKIVGKQNGFGYKLGLSATIREEYNKPREKMLFDEIQGGGDEPIFQWDLEKAIKGGILVEMDLIPLEYKLYPDETANINIAYAQHKTDLEEGMSRKKADEKRNFRISDVRKNARNKIEVFEEKISKLLPHLNRSFIFADESKYGDKLLNILVHKLNVRTHYGNDPTSKENLERFSSGEINCIINVMKLSQGIDVQNLNSIVLFATPTGRQFKQRLGRVLRSDPNNNDKRAIVIDFFDSKQLEEEKGSEYNRYQELLTISKYKKETQ